MNEWTSCKKRLPEGDVEAVPCIVTLVTNKPGWGDDYGPSLLKNTVPAEYDPIQKLWFFPGVGGMDSNSPINALLGEEVMTDDNGDKIDWACYVSHWMPYPEPAKEEANG